MRGYREYKNSGNSIIGNIPSRWNLIKFKRICYGFNNGTSCDQISPSENTVAVSRIETISGGKLNYDKVGYILPDSKLDRYKLNKGDILFSNINSYEKVGNIAIYDGRAPLYHGMNLLRIIPNTVLVNNKFLYHYLKSTLFTLQVQRKCKPAINQVSIPSHYVKDIDIPFPSLAEQESIASFLDEKTAKIDEYIDKKNKEIEALKEWKKALIAHVVTKGLNTNAKMKKFKSLLSDETPSHWKIVRNKNIFESHYEAVSSRKNIPLLSLTTEGVILRDISTGKGKFPKDFEMYNVVYPNNIIFCLFDLDETPRTVGLCYNYGMITNAYTIFKIKNTVLPEYITNYYLAVDNIKALRPYYSGLRKVVQSNRFNSIQIPLPPIEEQQEIVEYIDAATTKADKMIVELTNHVESMKEYKQRLIADVVTGKINVQPCNTCL